MLYSSHVFTEGNRIGFVHFYLFFVDILYFESVMLDTCYFKSNCIWLAHGFVSQ